MRVLVVNDYDELYGLFWAALGKISTRIPEFMADPEGFGLVCFTGGEDVSPELYGHENFQSHNSLARDKKEVLVFEMARKYEIPMTGICRGSQFLNVMCGGTMVQDLARHHGGGHHQCETYDGRVFGVTSSHHQMSVTGPGGQVLAWAEQRLGTDDLTYAGPLMELVPCVDIAGGSIRVTEAIYYPKNKVFGVQHHPEWQAEDCEAPQWTLGKIRELLLGEINTLNEEASAWKSTLRTTSS